MLDFFDINVNIGVSRVPFPHSFSDIEGLKIAMERYGIKKALVYHCAAREDDINLGNMLLLDELHGNDNLYPVWLVMPHHTGEFSKPGDLLTQMKDAGVKAVRMFPLYKYHRFSIAKRNCYELFSALEDSRVPVFLEFDTDIADWDSIDDTCVRHPDLNLILCGLDYGVDRNLYPLLSQHKNIYLETYRYKTHYGIEEICLKFGAERLVFGSGMPLFSGAAAVSMINYAHISEQEKKMIACDNIETLLREVRL